MTATASGGDGTAPRRGRWAGLLVLAAAAVGASALPTWVSAEASSALEGTVRVTASGTGAAPQTGAVALVLLAAAGAAALVGRVGRVVVGLVAAGAGVLLVAAAAGVLADPAGAVSGAVADATGVAADGTAARATAAPVVAVVVGVLVVALGVLLARARGGWEQRSSRHERPTGPVTDVTPGGPVDERSAWDALSRGDDPT